MLECTVTTSATVLNPHLPAVAVRKKVILAIDDDREALRSLVESLRGDGYDSYGCDSPTEALKTARAVLPDLIICGMTVGGEGGVSLCEEICRSLPRPVLPRTMYLSRAQTPDIIHRTDGAGSSYYLRKPLESTVLLKLIKSAV